MRMIRDATGRFRERPFYEAEELDVECEAVVETFLRELHGKVEWPISTDDITKLVESRVSDLDLYADLSGLGHDVEGVTDFILGRPPSVRVATELSVRDYHENRLRTTLTHELGHVYYHGYLFQLEDGSRDLFSRADSSHAVAAAASAPRSAKAQQCRRETILNAREVDWMEWQAGYACGAFLMPISPLRSLVHDFIRRRGLVAGVVVDSEEGSALVDSVVATFAVSRDAARIRLLKTSFLLDAPPAHSLFK